MAAAVVGREQQGRTIKRGERRGPETQEVLGVTGAATPPLIAQSW